MSGPGLQEHLPPSGSFKGGGAADPGTLPLFALRKAPLPPCLVIMLSRRRKRACKLPRWKEGEEQEWGAASPPSSWSSQEEGSVLWAVLQGEPFCPFQITEVHEPCTNGFAHLQIHFPGQPYAN